MARNGGARTGGRLLWRLFVPIIGLLLIGCTNPVDLSQAKPPLPFTDPNILGIERANTRTLETLEDALACLASRQPVYGIILDNSNVRPTANPDICRVGRVEQGTVVRVSAVYDAEHEGPLLSIDDGLFEFATSAVGFEEDVQPIMQRTCNSCHSGVVQTMGLQVTEYAALMEGSDNGPVVLPGDAEGSLLWIMVDTGRMPMVGELSELDKETIRLWIEAGAPQRRTALPSRNQLWFEIAPDDVEEVSNACSAEDAPNPLRLVNADLIAPVNCGAPPKKATVESILATLSPTVVGSTANAGSEQPAPQGDNAESPLAAPAAPAAPAEPAPAVDGAYAVGASAAQAGISTNALNLAPPSDADGWLQSRGGFCVEQRLPRNERSITALTFAPDGRLYLALDSPPAGQNVDQIVLYDAYHPSRSVAVYDWVNDQGFREIYQESPRITGLDWSDGALYISRSGEVGRIVDGTERYEPLAGGFAVNSQLFHANNGIVVSGGWVYVSAGGVRDGYSDGPILGMGEVDAVNVVAGGNPYAARIVRAPLDALLAQRSINVFQTAALGVRNPYGITADPAGRIWFTDNGATNVPDDVSAGDEVNVLDPRSVAPGDASAPYYGFPLALTGNYGGRYVPPAVDLPNTAAPTSITWAYNTIFYGQYGRDPGLYRLGRTANGQLVSERIMLLWPILATATAPDGALWVGTGQGGLYRMTPGCN